MRLTKILNVFYPGLKFVCWDEDYNKLQMIEGEKPPLKDLEAYESQLDAKLYQEYRETEYPSKEQLIVALWEQVIEGRPEAATQLQQQRTQIKNKYPKPTSEGNK